MFVCVTVDAQIREEIDKFGIKVYQFPECDSDEDEEFKQLDKELKVSQSDGLPVTESRLLLSLPLSEILTRRQREFLH